jgi:hypothetical protein
MQAAQGEGPAGSWWKRSFIRNGVLAAAGIFKGCTPSPFYERRYALVPNGTGGTVPLYFGEEPAHMDARHVAALEDTREALAQAYRLASREGIDIIVAFAPIAYRVYRDVGSFADSSPDVRAWTLNDLPERLAEATRAIGAEIRFIDLTGPLKAAARSGRLVYLPDDTHWTEDGHAVVADALTDVLQFTAHGTEPVSPQPAPH